MMLDRETLALVVVDLQEKLLPTISGADDVIRQCVRLIRFAKEVGVPILLSEQYPKGLGRTIGAIASEVTDAAPIEKMTFACMGDAAFRTALERSGRRQILLAGIETHVCVMQTALLALEAGYEVFLVSDAVAANAQKHHQAALERMARAGVTIVTVEMAIFETLRVAGTPEFKRVLALIK